MPTPLRFRQSALDRISTPDEFDRLVRVTSPRYWIGLVGLLTVVVAAVLWAVLTTIPTTETGTGFLLPEGGLRQIQSPVDGQLDTLPLQRSDHVVAGQKLGEVQLASGALVPIRATATGVVTELSGVQGTHVGVGQQLGLVEPIGWPAVVYAYLPSVAVSDVKAGTKARVRFAGGIGSTYGDALGTVQSVARFPTSPQRLSAILNGAPATPGTSGVPTSEVVIALSQSATTPSGFVWASGTGPPSVPLGLPAAVQLIVGSRHPIDDVF